MLSVPVAVLLMLLVDFSEVSSQCISGLDFSFVFVLPISSCGTAFWSCLASATLESSDVGLSVSLSFLCFFFLFLCLPFFVCCFVPLREERVNKYDFIL